MGQANVVTQRLFSLMDTISNTKFSVSHESCEIQRKKVLQDLVAAQQQIQILNQQWTEHTCWSGQNKSNTTEDITRYRSPILFFIFWLIYFFQSFKGPIGNSWHIISIFKCKMMIGFLKTKMFISNSSLSVNSETKV